MNLLGPASLLTSLAALAITLALLLGLALLARKINPAAMAMRKGKRLAKLESLPLTATHTLHLVSLDDDEQLIVTGPQGATPLPTKKKK